jgi:hypothetical protein
LQVSGPETAVAQSRLLLSNHRRQVMALLVRNLLEQIQRDIDDHILLATDHLALAEFDEDVDRLQVLPFRRHFSVTQEARIHTSGRTRSSAASISL